jgi:hypothetical protein
MASQSRARGDWAPCDEAQLGARHPEVLRGGPRISADCEKVRKKRLKQNKRKADNLPRAFKGVEVCTKCERVVNWQVQVPG